MHGGAPVIEQDYIALEKPEDSFVIVGIRLAQSNSRLTAAALMLYLNGVQLPPKGVVTPGVYGKEVEYFTGGKIRTHLDKASYVATGADGRAFRIWHIPASYLTKGARARVFLFPQWIMEGKNTWSISTLTNNPRPLGWTQDSSTWKFDGLAIEISAPGVYYVGDVEIRGTVWSDSGGASYEVQTTIRSDPRAGYAAFAWQTRIPAFPYFDFSRAWRKLPGQEFENYLWGYDSPLGWISTYGPPPAAPGPSTGATGPSPPAR
jgi:hypothetical protein